MDILLLISYIHGHLTINILYSNCKQTYYFTIIRYFILYLTESTSISIIVNTAYSISSALEHIYLCIER